MLHFDPHPRRDQGGLGGSFNHVVPVLRTRTRRDCTLTRALLHFSFSTLAGPQIFHRVQAARPREVAQPLAISVLGALSFLTHFPPGLSSPTYRAFSWAPVRDHLDVLVTIPSHSRKITTSIARVDVIPQKPPPSGASLVSGARSAPQISFNPGD